MKRYVLSLVFASLAGATVALVATGRSTEAAQVIYPEKLRFRLVGDEPIATVDGRSTVPGFKMVAFKDQTSDQCYLGFLAGSALSVTGPSVCP